MNRSESQRQWLILGSGRFSYRTREASPWPLTSVHCQAGSREQVLAEICCFDMKATGMPEKSFLDRAAEYTYRELERVGDDPVKLDVPQQTVAILYSLQPIIDNGGFQYLFENDLPYLMSYAMLAEAYRRIGATQAAERLDRAVAMFPFDTPEVLQDKRLKFMGSLDEDHEFFQLGDAVCGDETIWESLERYAYRHATSFHLI